MSTFNNARVPVGQTSKHILESRGGDTDSMRFYCTTNKSAYGRWWNSCRSSGLDCQKRVQSGYQANHRALLYYNPSLDVCDNPAFGESLKDNYESVTMKSYPGQFGSKEIVLTRDRPKNEDSGFTWQSKMHTPNEQEVRAARISSQLILPFVPCLKKINNKDPLQMQNNGRGPNVMLSETTERFKFHPLHPHPDGKGTRCEEAKKEQSGYSLNNAVIEPITFRPVEAHTNELPPFMTDRPTGTSTMKSEFLPYALEDVRENIPAVACKASLRSGFSKNNQPMETKTCYEQSYQRIIPDCTVDCSAGSCKKRTPTGFASNTLKSITALPDVPGRFITEYKYRYLDRTPVGLDREGHTWGKTLPLQSSGFVTGTKPSSNGLVCTYPLEPYEERSIIARDNYLEGQIQMSA